MSENVPGPGGSSAELRAIQTNFGWLVLFQFALLVGLVILYLQIGGIPNQTSDQIPYDSSGTQVLFALDPIGTNVTDLQTQVAAMAAKIDVICTAVEKSIPAAIAPNACSAP